MTNTNVFQPSELGAFADPPTEVLCNAARTLLAQAVEVEVADCPSRHADRNSKAGHQHLARHRYLPERQIVTYIGPMAVLQPRLRDREA